MNRRGFVGLLAGLAGALGLRGQDYHKQDPQDYYLMGDGKLGKPSQSTNVLSIRGKNRFCQSLDLREQPCPEEQKKGEEYCPLGHSQKPRLIAELPGEDCWWAASRTIDWEATKKLTNEERDAGIIVMNPPAPCTKTPPSAIVVCAVCGVVYVPMEKKP